MRVCYLLMGQKLAGEYACERAQAHLKENSTLAATENIASIITGRI